MRLTNTITEQEANLAAVQHRVGAESAIVKRRQTAASKTIQTLREELGKTQDTAHILREELALLQQEHRELQQAHASMPPQGRRGEGSAEDAVLAIAPVLAGLAWSTSHTSLLSVGTEVAEGTGSVLHCIAPLLDAVACRIGHYLHLAAQHLHAPRGEQRRRMPLSTRMGGGGMGGMGMGMGMGMEGEERVEREEAWRVVVCVEAVLGLVGNTASDANGRKVLVQSTHEDVVRSVIGLGLSLGSWAQPGEGGGDDGETELASRLQSLVLVTLFNVSLNQAGARSVVAHADALYPLLVQVTRSWPSDDVRSKAIHVLYSCLEFGGFAVPDSQALRAALAPLTGDVVDGVRKTALGILQLL